MSIHTSIGTPTANSYVSVSEANTYFNSRENSDAWLNIASSTNGTAANTRKENLLKMATREIDNTYRYHDTKYYNGIRGEAQYQALQFPRADNTDSDGNLIIPYEIQDATCEQALWIMERTGKRTSEDGAVIEKSVIGSESYNYLKSWINRQVELSGKWSWQGSDF